jgi:hypothetical protein
MERKKVDFQEDIPQKDLEKYVSNMDLMLPEVYNRPDNGEIKIHGAIKEPGKYYIYVISGIQQGSKTVFSQPIEGFINYGIPAIIKFGIKKQSIFNSNYQLFMEFTPNEYITDLPDLDLFYSISGTAQNAHDRDAVIIYSIPGEECEYGTTVKKTYTIDKELLSKITEKTRFSLVIHNPEIANDYSLRFLNWFYGIIKKGR